MGGWGCFSWLLEVWLIHYLKPTETHTLKCIQNRVRFNMSPISPISTCWLSQITLTFSWTVPLIIIDVKLLKFTWKSLDLNILMTRSMAALNCFSSSSDNLRENANSISYNFNIQGQQILQKVKQQLSYIFWSASKITPPPLPTGKVLKFFPVLRNFPVFY